MPEFLSEVIRDVIILFIVLTPVVVFLFYLSRIKRPPLSIVASVYLILIIGITLFSIGKNVYSNYQQPPKWDFLVFWLNGNVGISGENFYNPENYREVTLPYDPGDGFSEEIIDAGFWYPPFAMFLFLPLGLFEISKAYLSWQILNLFLCVVCIYGLWRLFLKDYGILSLLLIAVLMLGLEPTRHTFSVAQTNFLALLFFLMFWQSRSKGWGGIWLALCVVVKPYMALLYIYPLLTRNWKMLSTAVLALLTITLLSVVAFGSDVFVSFFNDPTPNVPSYVYTEIVNQSLLATILRLNLNGAVNESPVFDFWFLGTSVLLTMITAWVAIKKSSDHFWVILSILFLALIVYPASLAHYGIFLIVPVTLLLQKPGKSVRERMVTLFIIIIIYFTSEFSYMFYANLFMWFVCIVLAAKPSFEKVDASDPIIVDQL